MPKTLDQLERENNALRRILTSQAQIIKEMCECLPDELKEIDSVQRAISTSQMVINELGKGLPNDQPAADEGNDRLR